MDFKDAIKQLSEKTEKLGDSLQTEEATKNALIMPFIQALGYDVFNPMEVIPEYTCDIGTKKGERIDYAILKDEKPAILIECKKYKEDLTLHNNQILRYFNVSPAKFGILTNGALYKFYTDLDEKNKMDKKPFLEVDLRDIKTNQVEELKKFHKTYFDVDNILSSASELKYTSELKAILSKEFASPSPVFTKILAKQVYGGTITNKLLEQFTALVKRSISILISDTISERLKSALNEEEKTEGKESTIATGTQEAENKIETTQEELEGFFIIKSILRQYIGSERISYRDTQNYFTVIIDNNERKLVCRLYFNNLSNLRIAFVGDDKKETKYKLSSLDDIYQYTDELIGTTNKYIAKNT